MKKSLFTLIFSFLFYIILFTALYLKALSSAADVFTYPLDDSYIHMAIAENIIKNGVWGINLTEFASASSSPLYTILLSVFFFIFGSNVYMPLIINIIISLLLLYIVWRFFKDRIPPFVLFLLLNSIIIFTPLPNITLIAMEHLLHALLTLCYIFVLWRLIVDKKETPFNIRILYVISFILTIARYEGLFLIIGGSLVLFCLKKYKISILSGIFGGLSVSIFGLYFLYEGGTFFPYSVVIKTSLTEQSFIHKIFPYNAFVEKYLDHFFSKRLLIAIVLTLIFSFSVQAVIYIFKKNITKITPILLAFSISLIMYVAYSNFGWLDRYEAFIIPVILSFLFYSFFQAYLLVKEERRMIAISLLSIPVIYSFINLTGRTIRNTKIISIACKEIYSQQYQTAKFLNTYYKGQSVAINDIGYPSYMKNIKVVDIFGLGNKTIALHKKNKTLNNEVISELLDENKVKVAMIYEPWFEPDLYKKWKKIGYWRLKDPITVVAEPNVDVYVITNSPQDIEYITESIKDYNKKFLTKNTEFVWAN